MQDFAPPKTFAEKLAANLLPGLVPTQEVCDEICMHYFTHVATLSKSKADKLFTDEVSTVSRAYFLQRLTPISKFTTCLTNSHLICTISDLGKLHLTDELKIDKITFKN